MGSKKSPHPEALSLYIIWWFFLWLSLAYHLFFCFKSIYAVIATDIMPNNPIKVIINILIIIFF